MYVYSLVLSCVHPISYMLRHYAYGWQIRAVLEAKLCWTQRDIGKCQMNEWVWSISTFRGAL